MRLRSGWHSREGRASRDTPAPRRSWRRRCPCCRWWRPESFCRAASAPAALAFANHAERGAIFYRAAGIEPFRLGVELHISGYSRPTRSRRKNGVFPTRSKTPTPRRADSDTGVIVVLDGFSPYGMCRSSSLQLGPVPRSSSSSALIMPRLCAAFGPGMKRTWLVCGQPPRQ